MQRTPSSSRRRPSKRVEKLERRIEEDKQRVKEDEPDEEELKLYECELCAEEFPQDFFPSPDAKDIPASCRSCVWKFGSGVCYTCISRFLSNTLDYPDFHGSLHCFDCGELWPFKYVKLHPKGIELEKYEMSLLRQALQRDENFRWCPAPGCGAGNIHERNTGRCRKIICPSCNIASCFHCEVIWQTGHDCQTMQEIPPATRRALQEQKTRQCPRCSMGVVKIDGCSTLR